MELALRFLLSVSLWITVDACNGYVLHVRRFENCGKNDVLQLKNFNVTLTDDCFIQPTGCVTNEKEISSATVKYTLVRNMAPTTGTVDGCKTLDKASPEAVPVMELFGLPTNCPIKAGKVCNENNKRVAIKKYKNKLGLLLGDIHGTIKMDSNAGQACLEFHGLLTKRIMTKIPVIG